MSRESRIESFPHVDFGSLGLRPVTRWVPDTRDPVFVERYRRQRAIIADSFTPDRKVETEFWESVQTDEGWK
jgi:hypothetical protein